MSNIQQDNEIPTKYMDELIKLRTFILETNSSEKSLNRMKDFYQYIKLIESAIAFKYDKSKVIFDKIARFIEYVEDALPNDKLYYQKPIDLERDICILSCPEPNTILDYLVSKEKKRLFDKISMLQTGNSFEDFDLTNYCNKSALSIAIEAEGLGIHSEFKIIEPGYIINSKLYGHRGCHSFCILHFDDRSFLIDCTYSQFFYKKRCIFEKTGIMNILNCSPAFFMMQDKKRWKVAKELLDRGWIELKGDVLKHYLDGFTMFFRNGLYYENTGDFSFTTQYTVDDYLRFLNYEDNQIAHEDKDFVGYQSRPLKNPRMKLPH